MSKDEKVTFVKTDIDKKNGQDKCPKCGSTEIIPGKNPGELTCTFCRFTYSVEKLDGLVEDLDKLSGKVVTSGVSKIDRDAGTIVTLKCDSCGAEVVIDTASEMQKRCHWCRSTLSLNAQVPNGAVPDVILPFSISIEDAKASIEKFVNKRKFYAYPKFKEEFNVNNIMGVYFPYMLVDINAHANFKGEGEHQIRWYTVKVGDRTETRYDAELYHIERDFDILINDLSIESNSDRLETDSRDKTNNIINSIMPFDTENCIKYNSNFLRGYTSEKRDIDVEEITPKAYEEAKDIARFAANDTLKNYDRGVRWDHEVLDVKGEQWSSAYLPVWLYSYQQVSGDKKVLHYVAVNARTKETMGSVPVHVPKLLFVSFLIELFSGFLMVEVDWEYDFAFLSFGIIYYLIIYNKYRNKNARHTYEVETTKEMKNTKSVDEYIKTKRGLSNRYMVGANNKSVKGINKKKG